MEINSSRVIYKPLSACVSNRNIFLVSEICSAMEMSRSRRRSLMFTLIIAYCRRRIHVERRGFWFLKRLRRMELLKIVSWFPRIYLMFRSYWITSVEICICLLWIFEISFLYSTPQLLTSERSENITTLSNIILNNFNINHSQFNQNKTVSCHVYR